MSKSNAFLEWLPVSPDWKLRLKEFADRAGPEFVDALELLESRLDFVSTNNLAQVLMSRWPVRPDAFRGPTVKLAILSSSTVDHLASAVFIAGLRRGIWVEVYTCGYSQYFQELIDSRSDLYRFSPDTVLFAFDATHLTDGFNAAMSRAEVEEELTSIKGRLLKSWELAKTDLKCSVIQQTVVPSQYNILGSNEHRLPGSRAAVIARLNSWMRDAVDDIGADLIDMQAQTQADGLDAWFDAGLWFRSKQEVKPTAAPMYGELVARSLASRHGLSRKCLVLDLDNTLWGGVIGDDGPEGIVLGQGSALGEAYVAMQLFALELSRRGVILAVCSKNDEINAIDAFDRHPEMVLRRSDIACFVANWDDKPKNIRHIAKQLNIGLDSMVFLDDNPFERTLVRKELPMVAVPEVGDDPARYPRIVSNAGYFDLHTVTSEDRVRAQTYHENQLRADLKSSATDLASYLDGLQMSLTCRHFLHVDTGRIAQLINKTNQFNLTTRRYSEDEVVAILNDPSVEGFQFRLTDRFGDNGIIAVVILELREPSVAYIDTWLMSCRVLGREVEAETLNYIVCQAKARGIMRLVGTYRETAKNGMVRDHYEGLGFSRASVQPDGGCHFFLDLNEYQPKRTAINRVKEQNAEF